MERMELLVALLVEEDLTTLREVVTSTVRVLEDANVGLVTVKIDVRGRIWLLRHDVLVVFDDCVSKVVVLLTMRVE